MSLNSSVKLVIIFTDLFALLQDTFHAPYLGNGMVDFIRNNLQYIGMTVLSDLFIIYVAFLYLLHLPGLLGHIQISQIPKRDEPSDEGTINFSSFFKGLEEAGYDGWVAGEYFASGIYMYIL